MGAVLIDMRQEAYGDQIPRTHVYVDGKFVYQTGDHPQVHAEQLQKLFSALYIENVEFKAEIHATSLPR